jgi:IS605 OrfB family transposase
VWKPARGRAIPTLDNNDDIVVDDDDDDNDIEEESEKEQPYTDYCCFFDSDRPLPLPLPAHTAIAHASHIVRPPDVPEQRTHLHENNHFVSEHDRRRALGYNRSSYSSVEPPPAVPPPVFPKAVLERYGRHRCRVGAADPGERTFLTIIHKDLIIKLGEGTFLQLKKHLEAADVLQARADRAKAAGNRSKAYSIRKAYRRKHKEITNLVHDYHMQIANFIVHNFDIFLLPTYNTSNMVKKKLYNRNIGKETARMMNCWSHWQFRKMLEWKAQQTGMVLRLVSEAWTTKTCSCCGVINNNVGASKVFNCVDGCSPQDRDSNGARNILLKNLDIITGLGLGLDLLW